MRFWITKNTELPIHDQLIRQVVLGILSDDLPPGHKLPSVRALARRHHIHANTVSAAYHDLLEQGWLELRRGSGLYVRPPSTPGRQQGLDDLLTALLKSARSQGHEPEEVLQRLEHLVRPRRYERILIAEPDPAMREILHAELSEHLNITIASAPELGSEDISLTALVVALPTRAAKVRRSLPSGLLCIPLRIHSVRQSLEGESKPPSDIVVSVVSRSAEIRQWARAMLIAVGLEPDSLAEIDAGQSDWQQRIGRGAFVVTDIVSARQLPAGCHARVFRVIADSSLAELKQFCHAGTPT